MERVVLGSITPLRRHFGTFDGVLLGSRYATQAARKSLAEIEAIRFWALTWFSVFCADNRELLEQSHLGFLDVEVEIETWTSCR